MLIAVLVAVANLVVFTVGSTWVYRAFRIACSLAVAVLVLRDLNAYMPVFVGFIGGNLLDPAWVSRTLTKLRPSA